MIQRGREALAVAPEQSITEWAETHRILPKGTTPRPGPFRAESYQRGILDAVKARTTKKVVCLKSTQVGWTDAILLNMVAYYIACDPKPIMLVFIRDSDARDKSQKVIGPMIANCDAVRSKIHRNASRRSGNKTLLKDFDGGFLKIAAANSAANLRSDPIAVLMLDEVDGYADDVDGEGSPLDIAARRLDAFAETGETIMFMGSTPAKPRGFSTIENEYGKSSRAEFYVPCPFCGHMQPFRWRDEEPGPDGKPVYRFRWEKDAIGEPIKGTVRYFCRECERGIDEKYKQEMLDSGEFVHRFPERVDTLGFYIWAAYSPFQDVWHELAKEWNEAQHHPEKMKAFVNLRLAETWDEGAESITQVSLPSGGKSTAQKFRRTSPLWSPRSMSRSTASRRRSPALVLGRNSTSSTIEFCGDRPRCSQVRKRTRTKSTCGTTWTTICSGHGNMRAARRCVRQSPLWTRAPTRTRFTTSSSPGRTRGGASMRHAAKTSSLVPSWRKRPRARNTRSVSGCSPPTPSRTASWPA